VAGEVLELDALVGGEVRGVNESAPAVDAGSISSGA